MFHAQVSLKSIHQFRRRRFFGRVFTTYGRGGQLGHVTWIIYIHFRSPFLWRLPINLSLIGQAVSEEKIFEIVDGRRTDDGATPEYGYALSSPCEPHGSGQLTKVH